jgi:predicted HTH transcriptional regulator
MIWENIQKSLLENKQKIMDLIQNYIHITQAELSKYISINEKNIRINIAKLKAKGLLERIVPDKGGYRKAVKKQTAKFVKTTRITIETYT